MVCSQISSVQVNASEGVEEKSSSRDGVSESDIWSYISKDATQWINPSKH
jgi:hypothetical protein